VMAGVIAKAPDMSLLPVHLNARVPELLRRCLEKDPRRRWQVVASVRAEIDSILSDPRGVAVRTAEVRSRPLWRRAIPATFAFLAGGALAAFGAWSLKPPPAKGVTRFIFPVPGLTNLGRQALDLTSDGTQFLYNYANTLYLRPIGELNSFPIAMQTAQGLVNPTFSPDGKSIVFWSVADRALKRIPISGGATVTLCEVESPLGMSWADNDQIYFGEGNKGIFQVSANAGKPEVVIASKDGELLHGPRLLPEGKGILFTSLAGSSAGQWNEAKIFVQPWPAGERKLLIDGGTDARYLPTGHIIYYLGGNLLVVPFDLQKLQVTGRPVPVIEGVRLSSNLATGTAQFSVSRDGNLIYVPASATGGTAATQTTTVTVVDYGGAGSPLPLPGNRYVSVRVSPDGTQLALGTDDANIWVYDLSGKTTLRRLTLTGKNRYPVWAGDSKHILFQSDRETDLAIYWQLADGTGMAERLTKPGPGNTHYPESWLPGQRKFSYWDGESQDVRIFSIDDKKDAPLITVPDSNQQDSTFSPDGRWLAYRSSEPGTKAGIYVEPYPQTGSRYQLGVNETIAWAPAWSPDSRTVYFHRQGGGQLHAFALQVQPFQLLNTTDLAVTPFQYSQNYRMYDVHPDGKHFVIIRNAQQGATTTGGAAAAAAPAPEVRVVLNWFEELKKLAPTPAAN